MGLNEASGLRARKKIKRKNERLSLPSLHLSRTYHGDKIGDVSSIRQVARRPKAHEECRYADHGPAKRGREPMSHSQVHGVLDGGQGMASSDTAANFAITAGTPAGKLATLIPPSKLPRGMDRCESPRAWATEEKKQKDRGHLKETTSSCSCPVLRPLPRSKCLESLKTMKHPEPTPFGSIKTLPPEHKQHSGLPGSD